MQFNQHRATSIDTAPWLESDLRLFEDVLGVGFFYYGPRLWMVGEVEPLKALQDAATRSFGFLRCAALPVFIVAAEIAGDQV